jgi:serine palmitoyltransferase
LCLGMMSGFELALLFPQLNSFLSDNLEFIHWIVEGVLFLFIVYLITHKSYKLKEPKLTNNQIEELIEDFTPEPLVPALSERQLHDLQSTFLFDHDHIFPYAMINQKKCYNLASGSYLGFLGHPKFNASAISALEKYGVGSCGPRGFLGTVDVHLELEKRLKELLQAESAIIYSSQYAAVVSFICCIASRHDILVVDKGVKHAIKLGADLSRARVIWFDHNDMSSLRSVWESLEPDRKSKKIPFSTRIWLLVEGIYENYGDIIPLPQILEMKKKYCFRMMLEETNSIGVIGTTGRGCTEYYDIPSNSIECIVGSLATSFSSDGGFCAGQMDIIEFQRLNGSGYIFSASSPPYLSVASLTAITLMEEMNYAILQRLKHVCYTFRKLLESIQHLITIGGTEQSPLIHLRLVHSKGSDFEDEKILQQICNRSIEEGVLIVRAKYISEWQGRPSPR